MKLLRLYLSLSAFFVFSAFAGEKGAIEVEFPQDGAVLAPKPADNDAYLFKARVKGLSNGKYTMTWYVGDDKAVYVGISTWPGWGGSGPYNFTFVAHLEDGKVVTKTVHFTIGSPSKAHKSKSEVSTVTNTETSAVAPLEFERRNVPLQLYVDPGSSAARAYEQLSTSERQSLYGQKLAEVKQQPMCVWLTNSASMQQIVADTIKRAEQSNSWPCFVMYNAVGRDLNDFSRGGANTEKEYRGMVDEFYQTLHGYPAFVIWEPDGLAKLYGKTPISTLMNYAMQRAHFTANFLDASHPGWVPANQMAERLVKSGVDKAAGFAVNVSNFNDIASCVQYAEAIAAEVRRLTDGKANPKYVIDTSRSGAASASGEWCNPSEARLGPHPFSKIGTGNGVALWVKRPGESDGSCHNSPPAGEWCEKCFKTLAGN